MQQDYSPKHIEDNIQKKWKDTCAFKTVEDEREKFYCLEMFPYPSGKLHMGHVRNYTIGDVIARYQRSLGKNVLHPMGWDGFGLPAENAAINHNAIPAQWTKKNIQNMREQFQQLGLSYDWDRELATCDVSYYRWEQWFFTKLYERGLVYKKEAEVNWDPVDQTVLANEQVVDGRGWRSGAVVERKKIAQWFVSITDYAEELLDGLDTLDGWPESVKTMQRNWIGKSEGVEVRFDINECDTPLWVFTTRADTLMGVSYIAVAADHPLALKAAKNNSILADFLQVCRQTSTAEADIETMEKKGCALNMSAVHPITKQVVPIYCANFVLMTYGTGAVMAVPAHDARDFDFADKYKLPILPVIQGAEQHDFATGAYTGKGTLINSGEFTGLDNTQAQTKITDWLQKEECGNKKVNYRLRDWGVSRQRYWGCPIPMVYDAQNQAHIAQDLPVELPTQVQLDGSGSPLKDMPDFLQASLVDSAEIGTRETDTLDTFFESSWYYARFCCADLDSAMLDERANYWLPVDQYVGGIEHAVMHLLYARFFHKLLRDIGLLDSDEPFKRLLTQGMVLSETFYRKSSDGSEQYFFAENISITRDAKGAVQRAVLDKDQLPVDIKMEKMSKSKNNGVDPQRIIDEYGADAVRLFTMFAAPPEQTLEWNDAAIAGASRFLKRIWAFFSSWQAQLKKTGLSCLPDDIEIHDAGLKALRAMMHGLLQVVCRDYERQQFNTVVAKAMELLKAMEKQNWEKTDEATQAVLSEASYIIIKVLAPICPHICEQIWGEFMETNLNDSVWLQVDEAALQQDTIDYVVQINGKVRAKITIDANADDAQVQQQARQAENVQRYFDQKHIVKVIVVKQKLVNFVLR